MGMAKRILDSNGTNTETQVHKPESGNGLATAFPDGVALECIELIVAAPPLLLFKWRHVGKFTGSYTDSAGVTVSGGGQVVDVQGVRNFTVGPNSDLINSELYYDVPSLIQAVVEP